MIYVKSLAMSFLFQILLFFILFTLSFIGLRMIPGMDMKSLISSSEGAGWLYSEIGLIFGVLAAFTIQAQAKEWDELLSSIRKEVNNLRRLFWLSYHLSSSTDTEKLQKCIRDYLDMVVHEEWKDIDTGRRSPKLESAIRVLQEEVFTFSESNPTYSPTATALVRSIFESREERIFQSAKRIPLLLKATIYVGAFMMIALSCFIGVANIWIDFVFTGSIAFLIILIVMVIEDLEHPYRPGNWHITQEAYHMLLDEMNTLQPISAESRK